MLLIESGDCRILLDCGRPIRGWRQPEPVIPVEPRSIAAIVLSHAHLDHSGWIADFHAAGFSGRVYATAATRDLVAVQLEEQARRRGEQLRTVSIIHGKPQEQRTWRPAKVLSQFVICDFNVPTMIAGGARITLCPAGHLLGAAGILLEWHERSMYYTGDLGRQESPLYPPPAELPVADLIVSESTYGDSLIDLHHVASERLAHLIRETLVNGGRVIIPAFSLGRMQLLLCAIDEHMIRGTIPPTTVVVDSPAARAFAEVHWTHRRQLRAGSFDRAWFGEHVTYIETDEASMEYAAASESAIVLVAGGMADSIRAKRHLKAHIDDPRSRVILVSYQAPDSLGRRLLELGPRVRIDGRDYNKWADVVQISGFSGHADRNDLAQLLGPQARARRPIRLVHGEFQSAEALAQLLRDDGGADTMVPHPGDVHRLRLTSAVR